MSRKAKDRGPFEERRLGYRFADKSLLERALTHISALSGGPQIAAAVISGWNFSAITFSAW